MRRKIFSLLGGVLLILPALSVRAEESNTLNPVSKPLLLITELLANGANTNDEFIEIFNASSTPVDLTHVKIERASAASASESGWSALNINPVLSGEIAGGGYIIIGHESYLALNTDYRFKSNLSNTGGHLRVIWDDPSTATVEKTELDKLGWGTAANPEGTAAPAASSGSSLQRCVLETEEYSDSADNSVDFKEFSEPTPGMGSIECFPPVIVEPEPDPELPDNPVQENPDSPTDPNEEIPTPEIPESPEVEPDFLPIIVNELLPDPKAPATDAEDEYVELFNPNDTELDLTGWKLETGTSFSYRVFLDGQKIPAQGYLVVTSKDTNLTLSNSAGAARLIDKNGELQSEAQAYQGAEEGATWSLINGIWQWTTTPTPGMMNLFTPAVATTIKSATKKAAAKKTTTKKVAAAKKSTAKPKAEATGRSIFEQPPSDGQALPVNPAVLAVVGVGAVGYSLYEYRYDLRNRVERFRRHRAVRRASRAKA